MSFGASVPSSEEMVNDYDYLEEELIEKGFDEIEIKRIISRIVKRSFYEENTTLIENNLRHLIRNGYAVGFTGHTHSPIIYQSQTLNGVNERYVVDFDVIEPVARHSKQGVFHTHKSRKSCPAIVNVGSVGQPRDGNPNACYVIYTPGIRTYRVDFVRVKYDIEKAAERIANSDMPDCLGKRLRDGV